MTTSAIMQSGDLVKSTAGKTDFITGLDQNEQKVVDKAVENRIAEAEKGGKVCALSIPLCMEKGAANIRFERIEK